MAKIEMDGLEAYERQLSDLQQDVLTVIKMAVYDGASVVTDEVRKGIQSHPVHENAKDGMTQLEKNALLKGLGISPMKNDDGETSVKTGFDGYGSVKTKTWPKGVPVIVTARSLKKGTSWRAKDDFISGSVKRARKKAEKAMSDRFDKEIEKKMR